MCILFHICKGTVAVLPYVFGYYQSTAHQTPTSHRFKPLQLKVAVSYAQLVSSIQSLKINASLWIINKNITATCLFYEGVYTEVHGTYTVNLVWRTFAINVSYSVGSALKRGFTVLSWQIWVEQVDEIVWHNSLGLMLQLVIYFMCNNQLKVLQMIHQLMWKTVFMTHTFVHRIHLSLKVNILNTPQV